MKQAPEDLDGQIDGAAADRAGHLEATDVGAQLAQRIWGRYGGSPGVIPLAATRGLARRATRLSGGRLPLVADLQRRWAPAESPGSPDPLGPAFAQLPALAGVEGVFHPQPGGPRPVSQRQAASSAPVHAQQSTAAPGEESGPSHPAARVAQGTVQARAAPPSAADGAELGPAIQRRHRSGRAGPAIQRQVASPAPAPAAGDRLAPGEEISLPPPTARVTHDPGERQALLPAVAGSRHPGVASLQRQLDGTPRPTGQRQGSPPGMAGLAKPLAGTAEPDVTSAGAGGTSLIQARRDNAYRPAMPLVASAAGGRPATIQAQPEDAASRRGPGPAASAPTAAGPVMAPQTDLEQETDREDLVDRVLRQLMRRLAIEGERRGWGPWP